jgi:anti-sigma regulatory factor (Ser/Thr protein kinase)
MMASVQSVISNRITTAVQKEIFPGRYDCLAEIAKFVMAAAKNAGLDDFAVYAVETAVDEACTNIIEHAYCGEDHGVIECEVNPTDEGLVIILRDHGQPFNPKKVPKPNLTGKLGHRTNHGLGVYFMRSWMDEVHFEFMNGTNTVTMLKRRKKDE